MVIVDDNSCNYIKLHEGLETTKIDCITSWLHNEFNKAVSIYKDFLPSRAKKMGLLHILWIAPPTHKNFSANNNTKRVLQAKTLMNYSQLHENMSCLKMIKIWDHDDGNNYNYHSDRYTAEGLVKYWNSVHSAIHFWNIAIYPKIISHKPSQQKKPAKSRFKWSKHSK